MREAQFLKERAVDWKSLEAMLNSTEAATSDELATAFTQLTDDLAYAQTYYPESKTTQYLNQLNTRIHRKIYQNKGEDKGRFMRFMRYEVPVAVKSAHPHLLASLLIFSIATLIGVVSTLYNEDFIRGVLGDGYVNTTLENIKNKDPMAVYKDQNQANMFFGITINNIQVGLSCFALGIFGSIGTAYVLLQNGIMLGSFFTFLAKAGVFRESMLTVWIHGTIEISVIIIAGGAGFVMGQSILFPGTFSRIESFRRGVKKGLKVVIGTIPFFVLAGFLESYVTRLTEMPDIVSLMIIFGSLALVVWYYILYPVTISKQLAAKPIPSSPLNLNNYTK